MMDLKNSHQVAGQSGANLAGFKSDAWPLCPRSQDDSTSSLPSDCGLRTVEAFSEMNLK